MAQNDPLRTHLLNLLSWQDAHVDFDTAVQGVPPDYYGRRPDAVPYSLWQLVEHMRLTQHDILSFCRNPDYVEPSWPDDYWPEEEAPASAEGWVESVAGFRRDLKAMKQIVANAEIDLFSPIPHGKGQTYLREALLVADHNAYHVGQLVIVRRMLGIWND